MLLLLGLLLAVTAIPVSDNKSENSTSGSSSQTAEKLQLEEKLENLLGNVEGVGQVQVVLMTEEKKEIQGFYDSGIQQVTGVLVCAQGGGDPVVVQNIQEAVMALFQVDAHKIKIMKMK